MVTDLHFYYYCKARALNGIRTDVYKIAHEDALFPSGKNKTRHAESNCVAAGH